MPILIPVMSAELQAVYVYYIRSKSCRVLIKKYYIVLHRDNQDQLTERVMQKIMAESRINGEFCPDQGIVNLFTNDLPQALIYQNLDSFGVAFLFSNSDQDNKIAASLTLQEVTSHMLSVVRASSLERFISQPEDIYTILDTYIPNGQIIIANGQVYRGF